jgi:hypothetical protein
MKSNQRGVALITVLLILLILTALGITASMLMTQEDRTSSRQDAMRAALYAAEAGLRRGEATLNSQVLLGVPHDVLTALLGRASVSTQAWTNSPAQPTPPTKGSLGTWTPQRLGTYLVGTGASGFVELVNQPVAVGGSTGVGPKYKAFFTLYVRNNPEDIASTVLTDTDAIVRLVSVGFITDATATLSGTTLSGNYAVLAVKILEEELAWGGSGQGATKQKGNQPANTNEFRVQQEPNTAQAVPTP